MKTLELKATTQKSYYNKATVFVDDNNNAFLKSYDTIVCGIVNDNFVRFWNGYSRTTQNHINDFCRVFNIPTLNKKAWENLEVKQCEFFTSILCSGL